MPTGLIGIAIVFPIVFSINAAYRRREEALVYLASFKSAAVAIYYSHRYWISGDEEENSDRVRPVIMDLFQTLRRYLTNPKPSDKDFQLIYHLFSHISESIEQLREAGVTAPDISRANQYLREMVDQFERMRNILVYRTPVTLRAYTQVFLNIFPILFGPYFAYLSSQYFYASGFLVAFLYGVVLTSLDNIQDELENPYDGIGADDINLDIVEDYEKVF